MAEIILEPTALSKVIPLSLKTNEVDSSLVGQLITNSQFNTADTDAWFSFTLDGLAATTGTFDLALINLEDKSVFNHTDKVFNTNPFYYKLDSGANELTNEIRHAGNWVGQLVVTLPNGDSATRKFIFAIEGHILDGAVVQTILLDDYNALITDIEASKNELAQYNIDYASLIGTVTSQEEARVQAEELRVIADALRETKEGTRQTTFEANEVIRDGVVAAAIETEMIAQNVATKLTEKEATYAPRLFSVEQQLEQTEQSLTKRVDNLVIPISPENVNVEVTDAHVSTIKNRLFPSLKNRFEDIEEGIGHLTKQTHLYNKIINGNFVDTSIWVKTASATLTVTNNEAVFTPASTLGYIKQGSSIAKHKYYYGADIKTVSKTTRLSNPYGGNKAVIGDGVYRRISYIPTPTTGTQTGAWGIEDIATSDWKPIYIKNVVVVDLTETFGLGLEPTLSEFEAILSNFTDLWFDGDVSLYDPGKMFEPINMKIDSQDAALDEKIDGQNINVTQVLDGGDFNSPDVFGGIATKFRGLSISTPTFLNSVISFSSIASNGKLITPNVPVKTGHYYYIFAKVKSKSSKVGLVTGRSGSYTPIQGSVHSGSDDYELLSALYYSNETIDRLFGIIDKRTSNWDEIKADYMGVIDVTNYIDNDELRTKGHLDEIVKKEGFNTVYNITKSKHLFDAIRRNDTNFYRPTNIRGYDGDTETNAETITVDVLYQLWDDLIAEYPNELTKSVLGVDESGTYNINRVVFKPIGAKTKILITANMHGNGTNGDPKDSSLAVYEFIKDILYNHKSNKSLEFLRYNAEIDIIPCANPWGYNNDTRENSNGVDLNRNANSITPQAETVIMKNWLSVNKDARLYLDVHAFGITATTYNLTAFTGTDVDSFEKKVINEVGEYLSSVHRTRYTLGAEPDGAISQYAKATLNIPSLVTEFSVYAEGMPTHSAEMMTKYVEWIGNVIYKAALQSPYVNDDIILRTPDGMSKYKISIDNDGGLTTTLVSQ